MGVALTNPLLVKEGEEMILEKIKSDKGRGYRYKCKCDICEREFFRKAYWVERTEHQFCNQDCASKYKSMEVTGAGNGRWNGGFNLGRDDGYLAIYDPEKKNGRRYKMLHRAIMEEFLGRELLPEEVVHHINGERKDNRIENLMLFPNASEHKKYHDILRKQQICIA
jgi:hypothetical protein